MKKKKIFIFIGAILFLILVFPVRIVYQDGGSVKYKALVYSVTKHHKIAFETEGGYKTGLTIQVLGHTIYEKINNPLMEKKEEQKIEKIIKINNILYYKTEKELQSPTCGTGMVKITSFVPETEIPKENNQANFKGEVWYQDDNGEKVSVGIDGTWYLFENRESE